MTAASAAGGQRYLFPVALKGSKTPGHRKPLVKTCKIVHNYFGSNKRRELNLEIARTWREFPIWSVVVGLPSPKVLRSRVSTYDPSTLF